MEFKNLKELQTEFNSGKIKMLPDNVAVSGVNYKLLNSTSYPFNEIVNNSKKPMVIYSLDPSAKNKEKYDALHVNHDDSASLQTRLVFVWASNRLFTKPATAKFVPKERMNMVMVHEAGDPNDDHDISTKVEIVLSTFNSNKPIDAKVDTGAEMSSIRVNNLQINERQGVCSFNFYTKNITMAYEGYQSVKVGDATENRPLVTFNVMVPTKDPNKKDISVSNVKFNLNNIPDQDIIKGDEYADILLGMNFINAGKFRVVGRAHTTTTETIDWNALQEMFKDVGLPLEEAKENELEGHELAKVRRAMELLKEIL